MKIRVFSDIHLEWGPFVIPEREEDKNTVLVLAGDIGKAVVVERIKDFIESASSRFKNVVYIMGNHEHYDFKFDNTYKEIKSVLQEFDNVYFLEKEAVIIDDVKFICASLWTDFDGDRYMTKLECQFGMNDYACIGFPEEEIGYRVLTPDDVLEDHYKAKDFIIHSLANTPSGMKKVVVTHHAPSSKSIDPIFFGDRRNGAYVSNLEPIMYEYKPNLWIHGHTHSNMDYTIDETRVFCNPRGYFKYEENPKFRLDSVIEI